MRKILLFTAVILLTVSASNSYAQSIKRVTGKVTSADDGSPLPGVNVILKGTTNGTATDADGMYSLEVPTENGVLVFSFIGLSSQEVPIGERTVVDVQLRLDVTQLSEIVVTGSAPGITKKTLGYSLGEVSESLIQRAPGIDPAAALQGKVAGVRVVQNGAPGSNAGIRIRGTKSIYEGQQPLILIDGVIVDGGLSTINSEDIESMEILKSSSAAALYGSRGANGVVVIKTRRGTGLKEGSTQIVFRNEIGQNFLPGRIDLAKTHQFVVDPVTGNPPFGGQVPKADGLMNVPYTKTTDYQDLLFQNSPFYTNYLSISGNSEKANFLVSFQNTQQPGVIRETDGQSRQNFKANLDWKFTDNLTISTSNFMSKREIDEALVGPFFDVLLFRPDLDFEEKVAYPDGSMGINAKPDSTAQMVNPLYSIPNRTNMRYEDRFINSIGLNYAPLNWLSFEGFFGIDRSFNRITQLVPKGYLADDVAFNKINNGGLFSYRDENQAITTRANVVLSKKFGDFSISSRLGYWYEKSRFESIDVDGNTFGVSGINTVNNLVNVTDNGSYEQEIESENGVVQVGAVYKDKISLDALVRRDAVSLFGADNRSSTNYRVAASYRLTEDVTIPGVQELKIRASKATSGVWPRYNAQYEVVNVNAGSLNKEQAGNSELKPATADETEFGINANFLDRFTIDVTYVMNDTKDQIINVPLPAAAGYPAQWQNAGNVEYRGIEITLGANILNTSNFRWDANLIFDKFNQKVTDLPIPEFRRGTGIQQSDVFLIKEGESVGSIYATRWMRSLNEVLIGNESANLADFAINSDGYVVRANQLGTINEVPLAFVGADGATVHKVGDTNADFNLGFNSTLTIYKNLTVFFLFDWKQGGDIYSQTLQFLTRDNRAGYQDQRGKANPKPVGYYQAFYNTNNPSSYFVYDGSFLKLRELSITYAIPGSILGAVGKYVKNITLGAVGRNLWTLSDYPGYDPEVGQGPNNVDRTTYAIDGFRYPNFRTFSGSIQITF